jgi:hypothetical protein
MEPSILRCMINYHYYYNNAEILLLTGQLAMRYKEAKTTNLKIYLLMRLNFGKEQ